MRMMLIMLLISWMVLHGGSSIRMKCRIGWRYCWQNFVVHGILLSYSVAMSSIRRMLHSCVVSSWFLGRYSCSSSQRRRRIGRRCCRGRVNKGSTFIVSFILSAAALIMVHCFFHEMLYSMIVIFIKFIALLLLLQWSSFGY